eukprot:3413998-Alexandrium_andersonii.AAC.1
MGCVLHRATRCAGIWQREPALSTWRGSICMAVCAECGNEEDADAADDDHADDAGDDEDDDADDDGYDDGDDDEDDGDAGDGGDASECADDDSADYG